MGIKILPSCKKVELHKEFGQKQNLPHLHFSSPGTCMTISQGANDNNDNNAAILSHFDPTTPYPQLSSFTYLPYMLHMTLRT